MYQKILSAVMLSICTCTDMHSRKIYKSVLLLYAVLSCMGRTASVILEGEQLFSGMESEMQMLLEGMIPGGICVLLSFLTRQALGYGDSFLIAVLGMSLGAQKTVTILSTAFFWAGAGAFLVWRFGHTDRKGEIPFVPFLMTGFVIQSAGGCV